MSEKPMPEYHGMKYPLEQLPGIWLALAEELRGYAREAEDEPEYAIRFRQRAISIIACAKQLKWSLANRFPVIPATESVRDGWIACSERMPELFTRVLMKLESGIISTGHLASGSEGWRPDADGGNIDVKVTHWQPLPAPPTLSPGDAK